MNIKSIINNKEVKNAGWIIAGKIVQMLVAFVVSVLTTRYLGPSNLGLISYVAAYTAFFSSLCTLGINSVIIKNFSDHPSEEGLTLGTAVGLRVASSFLSSLMIVALVAVIDSKEPIITYIAALYCAYLVFEAFDCVNRWFQSRYESKVSTVATFIAYIVTSIYKIFLLVTGKSVLWFAFSNTIDYFVIALLLLAAYRRRGGQPLRFSAKKAKQILSSSYHYILSGMMIAIYGHTDTFMLKHMIGKKEVGYYSVALTLCNMWVFVLAAIIDSMYPTIISLYKTDKEAFNKKNRQLYCIVFYMSTAVSVFFVFLGGFTVNLLYGKAYSGSIAPLAVITWYTAFSQLGVSRNAWIVSEEKQKYLKYMYMSAVFINVGLNLLFINIMGATGAALASLITQVFTSIVLPLFIKEMRPNVKLIFEAIAFKNVFGKVKEHNDELV